MERAADGSVACWVFVGFREQLDLLRGIAEDLAYGVLTRTCSVLPRTYGVYGVVPPTLSRDTQGGSKTCHNRSFQPLRDQNVNKSCRDVNRDLRQGLQHLEKCYHEA